MSDSRRSSIGRSSGLVVDALHRPTTAITCLAAVAATAAWWSKVDVEFLFVDFRAFTSQPWRLVTCTLVHSDVFHLVFNLYWTWVLGRRVESRLGSLRTALLFVLLAAGSSAAEFALFTGGIGLSGVGYGLFGFAWMASRRSRDWLDAIDARTTQLFVVWFFVCIAATVSNVWPIANVAHGVGALLGAATAYALTATPRRRAWASLAIALFLACTWLAGGPARERVNFGAGIDHELQQRAYRALAADDFEAARRFSERALERSERDTLSWRYLSNARAGLEDYDGAAEAMSRAFDLAPDDRQIREAFAVCRFRQAFEAYRKGNVQASIDLYRESTSLNERDASAWFNLGLAYQLARRFDEARNAYSKAAMLEPNNEDFRKASQVLAR